MVMLGTGTFENSVDVLERVAIFCTARRRIREGKDGGGRIGAGRCPGSALTQSRITPTLRTGPAATQPLTRQCRQLRSSCRIHCSRAPEPPVHWIQSASKSACLLLRGIPGTCQSFRRPRLNHNCDRHPWRAHHLHRLPLGSFTSSDESQNSRVVSSLCVCIVRDLRGLSVPGRTAIEVVGVAWLAHCGCSGTRRLPRVTTHHRNLANGTHPTFRELRAV